MRPSLVIKSNFIQFSSIINVKFSHFTRPSMGNSISVAQVTASQILKEASTNHVVSQPISELLVFFRKDVKQCLVPNRSFAGGYS